MNNRCEFKYTFARVLIYSPRLGPSIIVRMMIQIHASIDRHHDQSMIDLDKFVL